jgi:hypothetical protein
VEKGWNIFENKLLFQKQSNVVTRACNPSTQEAEAEDHKFEATMGFLARSCLKKKQKKDLSFNSLLCLLFVISHC